MSEEAFVKEKNGTLYLKNAPKVQSFLATPYPFAIFRKRIDDYLYVVENSIIKLFVAPLPKSFFKKATSDLLYINENKIIGVTNPMPFGIFKKNNDMEMFLDEKKYFKIIAKPYPYAIFLKDKNLFLNTEEINYFGAFKDCTNLKSIEIPQSVKYIGPNAFENTALTQVVLASDCKYYSTSFPTNCEIRDINGNPIIPIDRSQL